MRIQREERHGPGALCADPCPGGRPGLPAAAALRQAVQQALGHQRVPGTPETIPFEITDAVTLTPHPGQPAPSVRLVVVTTAAGDRLVVPLRQTPTGWAAVPSVAETLVGAVLTHGRLPTEAGGEIALDPGCPSRPDSTVHRERDRSDPLDLLLVDGRRCVHHGRRLLDRADRTGRLLRLLGERTDAVPRQVFGYHYRDPADGSRSPLGLVREHLPGRGLDSHLADSLHAALSVPTAGPPLTESTAVLLRRTGRRLRYLHQDLAAVQSVQPAAVDLADWCQQVAAGFSRLWRTLPTVLGGDRGRLLTAHAEQLVTAELAGATEWTNGVRVPAGPCHGRLRPADLLVAPAGDVRLLGLAASAATTVGPGPRPPVPTSPWQDLAALEVTVTDLAWRQLARDHHGPALAIDPGPTVSRMLAGAARVAGAALPVVPPDPRVAARLAAAERAVTGWLDAVRGELLTGYGAAGTPVPAARPQRQAAVTLTAANWPVHPGRRLLVLDQLARLVEVQLATGDRHRTELALCQLFTRLTAPGPVRP